MSPLVTIWRFDKCGWEEGEPGRAQKGTGVRDKFSEWSNVTSRWKVEAIKGLGSQSQSGSKGLTQRRLS
jgi:hypothetical protein